jgi:hypothetical protein
MNIWCVTGNNVFLWSSLSGDYGTEIRILFPHPDRVTVENGIYAEMV